MEFIVNNDKEQVMNLVPQDCCCAQHVVVAMGLC